MFSFVTFISGKKNPDTRIPGSGIFPIYAAAFVGT
jgi:hypothetical protein